MEKNIKPRTKVLHIVEAFGGGVYEIIKDLSNNLSDKYEIIIEYEERKELPKNFKEEFNQSIKFVEVSNFTRSIKPIKDIKALKEINKIIKDEKPDIIQLHSSKAGILGRLARKYKAKLFYVPHGFAFLKQDDNIIKRKIYWMIEKITAIYNKKCTIIACSQGEYEEAKKLNKNSIEIDNGISIEKIQKEIKDKEHTINWDNIIVCTVGRIDYQKNPQQFNDIARKFPNIKFKWIGDGHLRQILEQKNIEIMGWIIKKDVLKEVGSSDIFILTSLWEGMPVALLEAMYMKKICIVSNVIGNRDVIKNNENGYIANNTEEFCKIIDNIIKTRKDTVSKNAHSDIIKKYSIKTMSENYQKLYERELKC